MKYTIPFNKPVLSGAEGKYVAESLASDHLAGDGPFTIKCQRIIEQEFGISKALLTTSCTSALEMAALLIDIEPGDEVILPSYTFVSTANAFLLRGATLRFVDIRPDTQNMDENLLEPLITEKTKAIVPVHYAGVGCEMDHINAVAKKHGVYVVEDAAQGVNGRYKDRYLGGLGDLGAYSFHETKNYICGEGGAILINKGEFAERAEILREKGTNRSQFFRGQVDKYSWVDVGSSYLLSDVLAAILYAQLEQMAEILRRRREIYDQYYLGLRELQEDGLLQLPVIPEHCESNYHMFYVLVEGLQVRTELIAHLKQLGIQSVFHYVPLHSSPLGTQLGYAKQPLPVTDSCSERLLRLPFHGQLSRESVATVVAAIASFFVSGNS